MDAKTFFLVLLFCVSNICGQALTIPAEQLEPKNVTVVAGEDFFRVKWTVPDFVAKTTGPNSNGDDNILKSYQITTVRQITLQQTKPIENYFVYDDSKTYDVKIGYLTPDTTYEITVSAKYDKAKINMITTSTDKDNASVSATPIECRTLSEKGFFKRVLVHIEYVGLGAGVGAAAILLVGGFVWCICSQVKACRRRRQLDPSIHGTLTRLPSAGELRQQEMTGVYRSHNQLQAETSHTASSNNYTSSPTPSRPLIPKKAKTPISLACSPNVPLNKAPARPPLPASTLQKGKCNSWDFSEHEFDQEDYQNMETLSGGRGGYHDDDEEPPVYGNVAY